jgi:hypothetical protein
MLNLNYNINQALGGNVTRLPAAIPYQDFYTEILAIAGGGRGGLNIGGGGGAGGYNYTSSYYVSSSGIYTVVVGAGQPSWKTAGSVCLADPGAGFSLSGSNSFVFSNIDGTNFYTMGGGAAACGSIPITGPLPASTGGSGGGGAGFGGGGGAGFTGANGFVQGFSGGNAASDPFVVGGGGGGAAATGSNGTLPGGTPGIGGIGKLDLMLPTGTYRAGGGTAAYASTATGSLGGGGMFATSGSAIVWNGTPNTGGGAGACAGENCIDAGAGGSGFVQFRYEGPQRAYGGQVFEYTNVFGDVLYTIHSFTASGVFQPIR